VPSTSDRNWAGSRKSSRHLKCGAVTSLGNRFQLGRRKYPDFISCCTFFLIFNYRFFSSTSRDSAVGIATGYGLYDSGVGVRVSVEATIFTSPCRLDRLLGVHPASYPMGTGGSFLGGKAAGAVKLTTHFQLLPKSRKRGSIHPLPHTSHGVVLN
jgi:hypothetical protein